MERKGGRIERVKGYKIGDEGGGGTNVLKAKNASIVLMFLGFSSTAFTGRHRSCDLTGAAFSVLTFCPQKGQEHGRDMKPPPTVCQVHFRMCGTCRRTTDGCFRGRCILSTSIRTMNPRVQTKRPERRMAACGASPRTAVIRTRQAPKQQN